VGNIWRFAYVAGENGGGAFLLVYVVSLVLVGLPVMLAEFALGSRGRCDVVAAFGSRGPWPAAGALALGAAFVILSYYAVITGWCAKYLFDYVSGAGGNTHFAQRYSDFVEDPVSVAAWQALILAVTAALVASGVQRGIERASRHLMPPLALIVVLLAGYALTLEGASRGIEFLFRPDWSLLTEPKIYLAAIGQVFFSLGLGMGVLLTYSSYSAERERLGAAAVTIAAGDTLFALAAGIAIFPAVFAFGLDPAQGPTLAFVTLPEVFTVMPHGAWVGTAFFLLLTGAALTSAVSLVEVPVAWLMRRFSLSRIAATLWIASAAFVTGLPSTLSPDFLGRIDSFASNVLLPCASIALLIHVGWVLPRRVSMEHAGLHSVRLAYAWLAMVRYVAPASLAAMLAWRAYS
jgi:NSS family neurotransmitter:Na+ symporter